MLAHFAQEIKGDRASDAGRRDARSLCGTESVTDNNTTFRRFVVPNCLLKSTILDIIRTNGRQKWREAVLVVINDSHFENA
jgi:hypothetical protein